MKLQDGSLTPLYQQVMDHIRDDIHQGTYAEGDRIPSEAELSEIYGVSRITVRRAVKELSDDGYLTKRQGKGTFVSRPKLMRKLHQDSSTQSFTDTCRESGREPGARLLGRELTEAWTEEREFLGLEEGARLIHVRRLRTVDGIPIMLENNFFPAEGFGFLLDEDLEDVSIFDVVEQRTGRRPNGDDACTLEIVRATSELSAPLGVPRGEPLFYEHIDFTDQDGAPMMIGKQYIVGSLYVFNI